LTGDGNSASASVTTSGTFLSCGTCSSATTAANIFGGFTIDILDYASTSKYKTARILGGLDANGSPGDVALWSGLWMSSSAISSIQFKASAGSWNFAQYSTVALFGVKAP